MELQGSVAIVTGSGNGIGAAIARKLVTEGARVALWDVNVESVQKLAAELDPKGERAAAFKVNVTVEVEVQAGVQETTKRFGRVDILVNNAGISRHRTIEDMSVELFENVIAVNLTGPFICCKAVVPVMKRQNGGKIVNIASLGGRTGRPGAYSNPTPRTSRPERMPGSSRAPGLSSTVGGESSSSNTRAPAARACWMVLLIPARVFTCGYSEARPPRKAKKVPEV